MDNYIGKIVDNRYEILSLIGVGGMSNVYKAIDKQTGRQVAVKFLKEEFFENEELVRRFKNESKAISVLNHDSIIKVVDFNITDSEKYIVIEYIDGVTLKEFMENRGKLTWEDTLIFANIILSALSHAHENGVVHRDLKPQNIMLTRDGRLKIMDFGIARLATASQRTVTDKAIGSVHYISPEQVRGQSTDGRSDIYSIGIMMYEMITGKLPFQSETAVSVALQQLSEKAQPVSELVPEVPKGLEQIIMKAIEKDPDMRYQSAAEMRGDIKKVRENPAIVFETAEDLSQTKTVMMDAAPKKHTSKTKAKTPKFKLKISKKLLLPVMAGLAAAFMVSAAVGIYFIFKLSGNPLLTNQPDVSLPSFVGMTVNQAKTDGDFKFEVEYVYNDEYEKDIVFSQTPKAPRTVKKHSTVKLRVSKGVMTSELPNLKNYTRSEAEKVLSELGVNIAVETEETKDVVNGSVIRTEPADGSIVSSGSLVIVYIAVDPTLQNRTVPNVVGCENLSAARKAITAAGLRVGSYTLSESHDPEGTVIGQTPSAGEEVPAGSAVVLVVSSGKPKCPDCGSEEHTVHPTCSVCGSKEHTQHPSCPVCGSLEHKKHPTCSECGENAPDHADDCPKVAPTPTPTPTPEPDSEPTPTPPDEPEDNPENTGGNVSEPEKPKEPEPEE
ncbi:MAG: Stk1 family PASTA domain-containing Ser/Thr kinase [Ruminococcaceae bacterium]|nr:Stk1 family PASTA domain-containing Ser/Thr kinase [Oscillospiraceae bacterium]